MSAKVYDIKNVLPFTSSLYPAAKTASFDSTGVDCREMENQMVCIAHVGTVSGTTPTLDGKVQESSDDSTYTDVSGATFTQVTASNNLQIVQFQRTKRYVRYAGTIAGTTPSFTMGVVFVGQKQFFS